MAPRPLAALVLCAGLGTRLDPLTRLVAKAAVPLGDRSLVERVLDWLSRQGVRDVVVNLHHRPESVTARIGDGAHLGLRVRYSWESEVLGSAGGPRHALPLLGSDPFVIVNGDTLCDVDLDRMLETHERTGARVTLAVVPNPARTHYNGLVLGDDDSVERVIPAGHTESTWHFIGIQIARAEVFAALTDGVPMRSIGGIYDGMLAPEGASLRAFRVHEPFVDVGTPRDYLDAARQFDQGLGGAIVWPGAEVEPNVKLVECIVAGNVRIPSGFGAREAVLLPESFVRPTDRVPIRNGVAIFPF